MLKNFKKWLLVGRHNRYHPHLLQPLGLLMIVVLLAGINLTYNLTQSHQWRVLGYATNINATDIISLTNQQREANGLPALATNSQLNQAAEADASYMFAHDYWAHYAPDGTSPWSFITNAGYDFIGAGQNLAKDFDQSGDVVTAWMNSPEHRTNILNSLYQDTGVAVMNGTLQGEQTTLVVAYYAKARYVAPPAAPAPSAPSHSTTADTSAPASQPAPAQASPSTQPAPIPAATSQPAPSTTITKRQFDKLKPVSSHAKRNWAENASLFIICVLLLLNVLRHTIVWRVQRRGRKHIWLRAHPLAQYTLLLAALILTLISGGGVIL